MEWYRDGGGRTQRNATQRNATQHNAIIGKLSRADENSISAQQERIPPHRLCVTIVRLRVIIIFPIGYNSARKIRVITDPKQRREREKEMYVVCEWGKSREQYPCVRAYACMCVCARARARERERERERACELYISIFFIFQAKGIHTTWESDKEELEKERVNISEGRERER